MQIVNACIFKTTNTTYKRNIYLAKNANNECIILYTIDANNEYNQWMQVLTECK